MGVVSRVAIVVFRRLIRWTLDHTFLMGWRFRPLPARELAACFLATTLLATLVGLAIGVGALVVSRHWAHALVIEARALTLTLVFGLLFFLTGGLTGVYLVPLTLRLPQAFGSAVRGALFFVAGVISMAAGLRLYTPITGLRLAPGWAPVMALADGVIICVVGLVIVRFHQLELEMRQAYEHLRAQQQREAELRELAARAELIALQAQINPHFFFNTLNSIAALIELDAARANQAIETLAGLFRYTLGASHRGSVTLEEEWRSVLDYLSIEKIRLGARLTIDAVLDPAVRELRLPGLLLQPLVENAVVHGIAPYASGGTVRLEARREAQATIIEISDAPRRSGESAAGQGVPRDGHGHGLDNVRRRLEAVYPNRHSFRSERSPGQGTRVIVEILHAPAAQPGALATTAKGDVPR